MKWYRFTDKLPELGTNIVVYHENEKLIGITEFNLALRKYMNENRSDYYSQSYYSDDASEDHEYDIRISDYWAYPSSAILPK